VVLAKKRVQAFDAQIALERKTNQALQLAKNQAHVRDDEEEQEQPTRAPLVDRMNFSLPSDMFFLATSQWIRTNLISKTRLRSADP
jgi:DNA helicase INO80